MSETEGVVPAAEFRRKHGMAAAAFCAWKKRYAGMSVGEAKTLKAIEESNARQENVVAEQPLHIQMLKAVNGEKWRGPRRGEMRTARCTRSST